MKKWIDEHVFLIEAFLTFINFPLLYIIYKQGLWTKEFMIPLFVVVFIAAISIDRYLKPFIKEKEVYCVDVRNVIAIVVFVSYLFFTSLCDKVDKQSFLGFLSMYPAWVIHFLFPIEQLLNHRNYVNGIEVEKYDFWSQDERKKKEQEKKKRKKEKRKQKKRTRQRRNKEDGIILGRG